MMCRNCGHNISFIKTNVSVCYYHIDSENRKASKCYHKNCACQNAEPIGFKGTVGVSVVQQGGISKWFSE
jgi:hypothetical protein